MGCGAAGAESLSSCVWDPGWVQGGAGFCHKNLSWHALQPPLEPNPYSHSPHPFQGAIRVPGLRCPTDRTPKGRTHLAQSAHMARREGAGNRSVKHSAPTQVLMFSSFSSLPPMKLTAPRLCVCSAQGSQRPSCPRTSSVSIACLCAQLEANSATQNTFRAPVPFSTVGGMVHPLPAPSAPRMGSGLTPFYLAEVTEPRATRHLNTHHSFGTTIRAPLPPHPLSQANCNSPARCQFTRRCRPRTTSIYGRLVPGEVLKQQGSV